MKWMRLLASCLLLISLVGCSGGNESSKESSQDTEEKSGTTEESVKEKDSSREASSEESNNTNEAESEKQDESSNTETNQTTKDQFDIISKQLVDIGYAPLNEWNIIKYRDGEYLDGSMCQSQFSGEGGTISILEDEEKIIDVEVAIPSDEEAAYEKLCSVFGACTLNIFFTQDDLQQIHDQLENAETNTDFTINGCTVNYSEGIDIIILGGGPL